MYRRDQYQLETRTLLQTLSNMFPNSKRRSYLTIMRTFLNDVKYWINAIEGREKNGDLLWLLDTRPGKREHLRERSPKQQKNKIASTIAK